MAPSSVTRGSRTTHAGTAQPARLALGAFLRNRREQLRPETVGLPAGGRRRTPGLRREEVAVLAGVGVTWYTWLEQGRDIQPSERVLDAICTALRLDDDEYAHVWTLATGHAPTSARQEPGYDIITADHLDLLARLLPLPACIRTAKFDILASNRAYRFLIGDIDAGAIEDRNSLVHAFLDPRWAATIIDHRAMAMRMVASLRTAMAPHLDDPAWTGLVTRMRTQSGIFDQLWRRRDLSTHGIEGQQLRLPGLGTVAVRFTRLWLDPAFELHIKIMQPLGSPDATRLERFADAIAGQPATTARPTIAERLGSDFG